MRYGVWRQVSAPYPKIGEPWQFVCWTESDKDPEDFDWNSVIIPLTNDTIANQNNKGIWYEVLPEGRTP